eukprot:4573492-Pyramimonas_sp.AAC.1
MQEGWTSKHLSQFRVSDLDTIYYVPDYVSAVQQTSFQDQVLGARTKWTQLKHRRLQNWGGKVLAKGMIPEPLPDWITSLNKKLYDDTGLFQEVPNHVLVNEYKPGEGIMPHEDGPLYYPVVAIISLGATAVIRFRRKPPPTGDQDEGRKAGNAA